ncbi:MAG: bis(5'-nucleosyl)-tetraphosphatase [Clostridiaceae bacterium]
MIKGEKSCGIILYNEKKEYLIIRHVAGHWDFPKGHVENSETEEETALREILEETGLEAIIFDGFRETVNYLVRGRIPKEVVYFMGRPTTDQVTMQPEEVCDFAFLPYCEARLRLSFESNRKLLDKAQHFVETTLR